MQSVSSRIWTRVAVSISCDVNHNTIKCDIIPLFIFSYGFRLNMYTYIKCLEEIVLDWIEKIAAERPYV